jgi:hypothetical protein
VAGELVSRDERDLAAEFRRFAELETDGSSALYERLSLGVAEDDELLELAGRGRPEQPAPNLLFAAVHYLLLGGIEHDLAAFYPTVSERAAGLGDPFPHFRRFYDAHGDAITGLLRERRVQTNVVERCGLFLPAFGIISGRGGGKPLSLVEVGASAGLNLRWDRYWFDYGAGRQWGEVASPVRIEVDVRGELEPPIPEALPAVAERTGIDLNPIDARDRDAVQWLRALVWPEEGERMQRLEAALALAATDPPALLKGDALDLVQGVVAGASRDAALCVYHSHTLNQFSPEARGQFASILAEAGAERDLYWLSSEYRPSADGETRPTLTLVSFEDGEAREQVLAYCDHHGRWLEWLADGL